MTRSEESAPAALMLITVDAPVLSTISRRRAQMKPALEILRERLAVGLWPIYKRTKHQAYMTEGRRLLFYVGGAGTMARHVVGESAIDKVVPASVFPESLYSPYGIPSPAIVLKLSNAREKVPVTIPRRPPLDLAPP